MAVYLTNSFEGGAAPTTVASGSSGGEISAVASWSSPSAGVLDVASTTGYPTAGTLQVVASGTTLGVITYTGISGNSFTGCAYVSGSATGTVSTGNAVTLEPTAGVSGGNSGSAFNTLAGSVGTGVTLGYSNVEAAHGVLSCVMAQPSSAANGYVIWSTSLTATTIATVYFRIYVWYASTPSAGVRLVTILNGTTFYGGVQLNTTGKLTALNAAGSAQTFVGNGINATTNALNTGAWSRIEGFITGSATVGQVSVSIYNSMDSTVATETEATAATLNTTGALTTIRFGDPGAAPSFTMYMDDLGASDTGYLGPALLTGSSAIAGTSALAGTGYKADSGSSLLAGTGAFADTGSKVVSSPGALTATGALAGLGVRRSLGTGLIDATGFLAGAGSKKTTASSLITATGLLAAASAVPSASAAAATGSLYAAGLKTAAGASAISCSGGLKAFPPPHSPAFTTGYPRSRWGAGSPQTRWQAGYPLMRWPAGQ
jgi:hypothetical protein